MAVEIQALFLLAALLSAIALMVGASELSALVEELKKIREFLEKLSR